MKHEAVIFDLDGTLLDTLADISDSMNKVLIDHGFPTHSYQRYKYFVGKGIRKLVEQALPENQRTDNIIDLCFSEMKEIYQLYCMNKTCMYDGIKVMLDDLSRKGIPMAVFSNKTHELTVPIVNEMIGKNIFKTVLGAQSSFPSKPSPQGAFKISSEMGIAPEKFAYVGDTDTDMKTARAAGMYAIGVLWGFRDRDELISNGAQKIVEHPFELIKLLD